MISQGLVTTGLLNLEELLALATQRGAEERAQDYKQVNLSSSSISTPSGPGYSPYINISKLQFPHLLKENNNTFLLESKQVK